MKPVIDTSGPDIETLDVAALSQPKSMSNSSTGIYSIACTVLKKTRPHDLFTRKETLIIMYRHHTII